MFGLQVLASAASLLLAWLSNRSTHDYKGCRCLHGDPCWPTDDAFKQLASQLSTSLIHPRPLAHPCYVSPNSSQCLAVQENWEDGNWKSDQPGSMQFDAFETYTHPGGDIEACYRDTTLRMPCRQGSVPTIGVDARTVKDIQVGIKFAASHNLRLVVKNTGHDLLARSTGRGAFMIWTHNMKGNVIHERFTPAGAPVTEFHGQAVTVAAGVQWHEVYSKLDDAKRMVVGGVTNGGSVGAAGGWIQGGGHSNLSPSYGLGVDNVLEFDVVLSNGEYVTANAHQHPDLFWALRGGGGATFGVVTSVTYRTYPAVPVVAVLLEVAVDPSYPNQALKSSIEECIRISSALTDEGWGGYLIMAPSSTPGMDILTFEAIVPNLSWEAANRTIQPYLDYVQALADDAPQGSFTVRRAETVEFPTFWTFHKTVVPRTGQVGVNLIGASWLLPQAVIHEDYGRVADLLLPNPGLTYYMLVAGGQVSKIDPSRAGLNPAWREAGAHVVVASLWPDGATTAEIQGRKDMIRERSKDLRALAPESGAYFNEASMSEPDFQRTFFGDHYDRLLGIKTKYDPISLFVVAEGVGSEKWDEELLCRV